MKTFGKKSFLLYVIISLAITLIPLYMTIIGKLDTWVLLLIPLNIAVVGYGAYLTYIVITISDHELCVELPFRKKKTTYFMNDIQVVTFDVYKDDSNKTQKKMTVQKKDNTEDTYNLSGFFFERVWLQKELSKHVDIL
ncbi:MAG: hypothetical protein R2800_05260 [Flavipsychrobacter sp.]